jgi:transposase
LLLAAIVHAADVQDRDGGVLLMATLFGMYPFLLRLYADSGYQGQKFQQGLKRVCRQVNLEIVRRSDAGKFVVLPKRWIVERTIGWLNRCRRLGKDGRFYLPGSSSGWSSAEQRRREKQPSRRSDSAVTFTGCPHLTPWRGVGER